MLNDSESSEHSKTLGPYGLEANNCSEQGLDPDDRPIHQSTGMVASKPASPRRSASLASWNVAAMHAAFIVLGWVVFAWSWIIVLSRPIQTGNLWWLMGAASILAPALTLAWIMHNVGINRRKGPRRAGRATPLVYDLDFHGHRIDADWDFLRTAQCIEIGLNDEGVKWYRAVPAISSVSASAHQAREP